MGPAVSCRGCRRIYHTHANLADRNARSRAQGEGMSRAGVVAEETRRQRSIDRIRSSKAKRLRQAVTPMPPQLAEANGSIAAGGPDRSAARQQQPAGICLSELRHGFDMRRGVDGAVHRRACSLLPQIPHISAPWAGLLTMCRARGAAIHGGSNPCQRSLSSTTTATS